MSMLFGCGEPRRRHLLEIQVVSVKVQALLAVWVKPDTTVLLEGVLKVRLKAALA